MTVRPRDGDARGTHADREQMAEATRPGSCTRWPRRSSRRCSAFRWRLDSRALEQRPGDGPAPSSAPNHISVLDSFFVPLGAAPADHLRRQGRVHGQLEDEVPLPGPGHDPDRPRRRQRRPSAALDAAAAGARAGRAVRHLPRGHPGGRAAAQGPHRRRPPGAAHRCARSSRSASGRPSRSCRRMRRFPKPFRTVTRPLRPADRRRPLRRPGRRPHACCARSPTR